MTDDEYRARYLEIEADFNARSNEAVAPSPSSGRGCSGRYWYLGEVIRGWPAAEMWRAIEAEKNASLEQLDLKFYGGSALDNAPEQDVEYDSEKLESSLKTKGIISAQEFNELAKAAEISEEAGEK